VKTRPSNTLRTFDGTIGMSIVWGRSETGGYVTGAHGRLRESHGPGGGWHL